MTGLGSPGIFRDSDAVSVAGERIARRCKPNDRLCRYQRCKASLPEWIADTALARSKYSVVLSSSLPERKGAVVERSLSVLLPVRDEQSTLAATILEILEILPELTPRFELIVIDDGSKDATLEVADDLASRYPQLRAIHHAKPLGRSAAIRTGLRHSSGEVVFLRDYAGDLALDEVRKLWWAIDEHPMVLGRPGDSGRRARWLGWKRRGGAESFRMVDRGAIRGIQESLEEQTQLMASMVRQGDSWYEIEIGRRGAHRPAALGGSGKMPREKRLGRRPQKETQSGSSAAEKVDRPKYLRKLRDFALGE